MRELTLEEIELIAGGQSTYHGDAGRDDGDDGDDGDYGDYGDDGYPGDGGVGGNPPPVPHTPDCTATHIAQQIKTNIGDNKAPEEWSAFIYKDPVTHEIERSNVITGPQYQTADYSPQAYGIPNGAVLEGFEHVHPTFNADSQVLTERAFADNGDLNALQNPGGYAVPGNNITVDVNNFSSYILHDTSTNGSGWVVDRYDHSETVGNDYSGPTRTIRPETPKEATIDLNNPPC